MRFAVPMEQLVVWLLAVPVFAAIPLSSVALARRRRARAAFAEAPLMERLALGASLARERAKATLVILAVFFLGLVWNWGRSRPSLPAGEQLGSDLSMAGHVFFLFAAWFLCGLLGAPNFTLRPELLEEYGTLSGAASMGSLVSVFLVLGWGFTFFGQRISMKAR